jgi:hypothetical protein
MKMKTLLIALCLATTSCTALTAATTIADGISVHADSVTLSGAKALAIAADAYAGVSSSIAAAVRADTPHLTNGQLLMIKTLNDQAIRLIDGADTSLTVAQRAASLSLIVTQLHSILGK